MLKEYLKSINKSIVRIILVILFTLILLFIVKIVIQSQNSILNIEKGPETIYKRFPGECLQLDNGNVIIIGSLGSQEQNKAELFNINEKQFMRLPDTIFSHRGQTYLFQKQNKVLVLDDNPVEIFDINKNIFYKTDYCITDACNRESSPNSPMTSFKAYDYSDNQLLIHSYYKPAKLYFWDYRSGKKQNLPEFNIKRIGYNILFLPNKKIMILGGHVSKNSSFIEQTEIYNPATNKFSLGPKVHLDSSLKRVDTYNAKFQTENYIYSFDDNKNNFVKNEVAYDDNLYSRIQLNKKFDLLVYNDIFKGFYVKLFDNELNIDIAEKKLLYRPVSRPIMYFNLMNNSILILQNEQNNYLESLEPTQHTQIISITKSDERR